MLKLVNFALFMCIFSVNLNEAVHNEAPCSTEGCSCFDSNANTCSGTVRDKFGSAYSCPSQPDNVLCCCGSVGSGSRSSSTGSPCSRKGCNCFDQSSGSCSGTTHVKIGDEWSCPNDPDNVICCCGSVSTSGGGGGGGGSPCNRKGCKCFDQNSGSCSGSTHVKIGNEFSCPHDPDSVICCCGSVSGGSSGGGGSQGIVSAARSQMGFPYVWGGGGKNGPSGGGFDCSGLTQYAVYRGTGKAIPRTAQTQYDYNGCTRVGYGSRQPGDLIFWGLPSSGGGVYHVAVDSGNGRIVYAPTFGQLVKEGGIYNTGEIMPFVRRC